MISEPIVIRPKRTIRLKIRPKTLLSWNMGINSIRKLTLTASWLSRKIVRFFNSRGHQIIVVRYQKIGKCPIFYSTISSIKVMASPVGVSAEAG